MRSGPLAALMGKDKPPGAAVPGAEKWDIA